MNDKSRLLDDLRIDREHRAEAAPAHRWIVMLALSLVLDGIGPGARVALGNPDRLSDGMRVRVSD
jgi:hypothetical protein